jgi:hypothetical protein
MKTNDRALTLYDYSISCAHAYCACVVAVDQATIMDEHGRMQRLACVSITGSMRTTSTAAPEVLLVSPTHLVEKAEADASHYRLREVSAV